MIFSFFSRMEEPLESYNQAQRATTTILNTSHPAEHINFFTARPPTSSMNSQVIKNCSNLSRLVQTQTCPDFFKLIEICPNLSEIAQMFKPV